MALLRLRTPSQVYILPRSLTRKPAGVGRVETLRLSRGQCEQILRSAVRRDRVFVMRELRRFVSRHGSGQVRRMKPAEVIAQAARQMARRVVWRHSAMPVWAHGHPDNVAKRQAERSSAPDSSREAASPISLSEPRWQHASEAAQDARPSRAEGGDDVLLRATTSGAKKGETVTFELFNETEDASAPAERVTGKVVEVNGDRGVAEASWTVRDLRRGSGGQEITFRATCKGEATKRAALPVGFAFGRALSRTRQPRENWPFAIYEKGAAGSPVHEGTTTVGGQIVAPFPYAESYVVRPRRT